MLYIVEAIRDTGAWSKGDRFTVVDEKKSCCGVTLYHIPEIPYAAICSKCGGNPRYAHWESTQFRIIDENSNTTADELMDELSIHVGANLLTCTQNYQF